MLVASNEQCLNFFEMEVYLNLSSEPWPYTVVLLSVFHRDRYRLVGPTCMNNRGLRVFVLSFVRLPTRETTVFNISFMRLFVTEASWGEKVSHDGSWAVSCRSLQETRTLFVATKENELLIFSFQSSGREEGDWLVFSVFSSERSFRWKTKSFRLSSLSPH